MNARKGDLAIVIALAAIAHFTYFALRFGSFYFPDSFTYLNPAKAVLAGHGFIAGRSPEIETIRTPGYPVLLMLFGARTVPVIVLQHLLSVALAAGIFLFLIERGRLAAYTAAMISALDVPSIHIANKLLTETLFTAILFAMFVLAVREKPRVILVGILAGFLVLVRPIAIAFFLVLLIRIPRRQIAVFIAASLLLPLGWATRNWARTHVFTISSIGDINLLTQRAAGVLAIEDDGDFARDLADEQRGLIEDADDFIQAKLHIPDAQELPTPVRAKYYGQYARQVILQHKIAFSELTARGVLVNLFSSDWDSMEMVSLLPSELLERSLDAVPVIVFVLATIGVAALWNRRDRDRPLALMIALTVAYFIVISAGGESEYRFRIPVLPQLAIAAGIGVETIRRAVASR